MNFLAQNKMKITNEGIFQRHWCEYRVGGLQGNRTRSLNLSGWQDLESAKTQALACIVQMQWEHLFIQIGNQQWVKVRIVLNPMWQTNEYFGIAFRSIKD